jgi:voltage-gated potassium channel Kch
MFSQANLTKKEALWPLLIFFAVIFTAAEAPYSFILNTRIQQWQVWLDVIFSTLFTVDLIYTLKQKKVKPLLKEVKDYKYHILFSIDLMSCVPFDLLFYLCGFGPASQVFKLLRLGRLFRIIKIYEILNSLALVPRFIKILMATFLSLVVIHWFTLIWIYLHPPGLENHTTYYIKCLYWTVTTLTTVGYGDIVPTTNIARLYTMFVMLLGVGVYGIVIGNISRIFAESARHKEQAREKFSDLSVFMKHYHIPNRLQSSVFNYYNHLYSKRLSDNDTKIIAELPQAIKQELQIYMNIKLIRNLSLFKNSNHACLKAVANALEQKFYGPGDTIIHIGETGDEMFIIGHGVVDVIASDGNIVAQLHEGQFFGEAALLVDTTRNANVRASAYTDLYRLGKDDFDKIVNAHPELKKSIMAPGHDRRKG